MRGGDPFGHLITALHENTKIPYLNELLLAASPDGWLAGTAHARVLELLRGGAIC